jgi:hypothetical protein
LGELSVLIGGGDMAEPPKEEKKSKKQVEANFEIPIEHGSEGPESSGGVSISPESAQLKIRRLYT